MKYNLLGNTDIKVSQICLGTMTWGEQNTAAEAHQQLDYAVESGINFIDTAELYPVPPRGETQGLTEDYIGTWLKNRDDRDKLIIANKVCARAEWLPYLRDGKNKLNKDNIEAALNTSLKRLNTDYIDLYQLHWPERKTNFFGQLGYPYSESKNDVPIEETLEALNDLIKIGKIRMIGISNETSWGCAEYLRLSKSQKLPRIVSIQNPYNLLNRVFEIGLAEFAHREQTGLLAYSPLAFGALSGKYLDGKTPEKARLTLFKQFGRYLNSESEQATRDYVKLAHDSGLDAAKMALAYVNSRPFVTSNIIGATTMEQLTDNIDSVNLTLKADVLEQIEAIHTKHPNPAP